MAIEFAPNVRVNGVAPASVVEGSQMFPRDRVLTSLAKYKIAFEESDTTEALREKLSRFYADRTLLKRAVTPKGVAEAAFLLASESEIQCPPSRTKAMAAFRLRCTERVTHETKKSPPQTLRRARLNAHEISKKSITALFCLFSAPPPVVINTGFLRFPLQICAKFPVRPSGFPAICRFPRSSAIRRVCSGAERFAQQARNPRATPPPLACFS